MHIMSNKPGSKIRFAATLTALMIPLLAMGQNTLREKLRLAETQVEKDPAAALKSLDGIDESSGDPVDMRRRARFLQSRALMLLQRYPEAENTISRLLGDLTADAESDPLMTSRTAYLLAQILSRQSRAAEADAALKLAIRQLPPTAPPKLRGDILLETTRNLIYQGEPVNAAEKATEALKWGTDNDLGNISLQARYLLGYAYRNLKDIMKARTQFSQVRADARRLGNRRYEILSMNELGNLMVMEEKPKQAMLIKREALTKAREAKDDYLISVCMHDIGYAQIALGEFEQALEIYRSIVRRETALKNPRAISMANMNIAYIYSRMGRDDEALRLSRTTLESARKNGLGELEPEILTQIIDIQTKRGRLREALKRQQELTDLNEKLSQRELDRKISEIQDRHRLVEQEAEIRILRQDKKIRNLRLERQRFLIISMIGLLFFLFLLAILALFGYRTKRRANRELETLNLRLDELSRHDTLTGLSNRRDMMEKLALLKARADRDGTPLAMLMIDMDHFKAINDKRGHDLGDRVLQSVARVLAKRIRGQDLLARWGGEEFLIALADTDHDGALKAAEQFRRAVEKEGSSGSSPDTPVTITVGVARYEPGEDLQSLITRADDRLYVGKRAGRNRVAG